MAQKIKKAQIFFLGEQSLIQIENNKPCKNWILSSGLKDTACHTHANKKLKNIEKSLKMIYVYFIWTKLDSKSCQIKGLDVTFQMHRIAKIFDIVKYLEN